MGGNSSSYELSIIYIIYVLSDVMVYQIKIYDCHFVLKNFFMVAASAVRQHILTDLKQKFKTVDEAEDALGLSLETYVEDSTLTDQTAPSPASLNTSQTLLDKLHHLTSVQLKELIVQALQLLVKVHTPPATTLLEEVANTFLQLDWITAHLCELMATWFQNSRLEISVTALNKCFDIVSKKFGTTTNVLNFPQLSLYAMRKLQELEKSNTVYNLSKVISETRPGTSESLMPLKRMPFGMIQFAIDFFATTNVMQVINLN